MSTSPETRSGRRPATITAAAADINASTRMTGPGPQRPSRVILAPHSRLRSRPHSQPAARSRLTSAGLRSRRQKRQALTAWGIHPFAPCQVGRSGATLGSAVNAWVETVPLGRNSVSRCHLPRLRWDGTAPVLVDACQPGVSRTRPPRATLAEMELLQQIPRLTQDNVTYHIKRASRGRYGENLAHRAVAVAHPRQKHASAGSAGPGRQPGRHWRGTVRPAVLDSRRAPPHWEKRHLSPGTLF